MEVVLIADPKVVAIPINECHEPLVDLKNQTEILFGPFPESENNQSYTWVRQSIFQKLKQAQKLLPNGLRLFLYEGLRTIELQKEFFALYCQKIKRLNPNLTPEELFDEACKMYSPVTLLDGTINTPPHSTGAAVDVYLVNSNDLIPVDMGILVKDWMADEGGVLSKTGSPLISKKAEENRKILADAMTAVGFVNYPTEYWHWSYGDRYWAFVKKQKAAIFGTVSPPA